MELQWPLILFTTLLAWSAGLFGSQCLWALRGHGAKAQMPALIGSAALLVVGGVAVFFHLEHWERIFNGSGRPLLGKPPLGRDSLPQTPCKRESPPTGGFPVGERGPRQRRSFEVSPRCAGTRKPPGGEARVPRIPCNASLPRRGLFQAARAAGDTAAACLGGLPEGSGAGPGGRMSAGADR